MLATCYVVILTIHDRGMAPGVLPLVRLLPPAAAMLGIASLLDVHPVLEVIAGSTAFIAVALAVGAVPRELIDAVLHRNAPETTT